MTSAPTQAELDAARLVLDRMGVTAEDLLNSVKPPAPTFGEYILWGAKTWLNVPDLRVTLMQVRPR